jgi:predicted nuclease of predicted toxin-antitoxin system
MKNIRLLIDESTGRKLFNLLKDDYDAVFVGDVMPSSSPDTKVLEYAEKEKRVLITDDKDFGELVFRLRKASNGVILLRMSPKYTEKRIIALKNILTKFSRLEGKFIVLEEKTARIREI